MVVFALLTAVFVTAATILLVKLDRSSFGN